MCESIATWFEPRGHVPESSTSGLNRWSESGSTLDASCGAPPVEITFPLRPTSAVRLSLTDPTAVFTWGNAFTLARSDSGKLGALTPFP